MDVTGSMVFDIWFSITAKVGLFKCDTLLSVLGRSYAVVWFRYEKGYYSTDELRNFG